MAHISLFSSNDWASLSQAREEGLKNAINEFDPDRLLGMSDETVMAHISDLLATDVPILHRDKIQISHRDGTRQVDDYGRTVTIPTTEVDVTVPHSGPSDAFKIRPSTYRSSTPRAFVASTELLFTVDATQRDPKQVRHDIDAQLDEIEFHLDKLRADVERHRPEMENLARQYVAKRRAKLLSDRNLISNIGYEIKVRPDTPRTYAPPDIRRKLAPTVARQGTGTFKPEPALDVENYKHILKVIADMAIVIERSPSAFKDLDEEALRFLFLVPLNGHYEGSASGEVFNYQGKTDILIRVDGKNIFIAECKFWAGPKNFSDTIDQILRYTSWRDTKTAIILFNKNKNFTKVIDAIPNAVTSHPNFRREGPKDETIFQYTLHHPDDPDRELSLAILAFDVPHR
ncbi:hypothetical protein ACFOGJ_24130 [Marinibaculum pumilum]|uniref:Restriction endonuclease n=1 Tax=Marinibaculum pumilum TaxID=1766165 RepID=A0ABV7L731_9PROT